MVVSILLFSVFLYASKHIDLLKKGIAVFFENPTKYKCEITEIDQDVIFSLNLIDLSSNIGKTIYDDGECTIDIEYVQYDGNVYNITFRTHGQYNMRRGVLVTALPHIRNSNGTYTQDIHSKLYIRNREEWLPCRVTGIYGIVFKDGDKFVYTFQSTAESEVTLKISKLLKHEWYE